MLTLEQKGKNQLRMNGLVPEVRDRVEDLLNALAEKHLYFIISSANRTIDEQNALYNIGRRGKKGERIVTKARGGYSWHNFGRAVDLVLTRGDGKVEWQNIDINSDGHADYTQMGQIAKNHGFVWRGDFKGLADLGHIEYHPCMTLAQARMAVKTG